MGGPGSKMLAAETHGAQLGGSRKNKESWTG